MKITDLNTDNVSDYEDILDEDISESIGREFYCGIVASTEDDPSVGAMIWEYRNVEDDDGATAELCYINADSKEDTDALLTDFAEQAMLENVSDTFFEISMLPGEVSDTFKEHGFDLKKDESRDIVVKISELSKLATMVKKIPGNIECLGNIREIQFMQGVTNCIFNGKKGLLEDLEYIEKDWFDEDISSCVITDNKISGLFLVHRFPSGKLMPVLLAAIGPDARKDILYMIVNSAQKGLLTYPPDTGVIIRRHNQSVRALAKKLFPNKTGETVIFGEKSSK